MIGCCRLTCMGLGDRIPIDHYYGEAEQVIRILSQAAYSSKYTQLKLPIVVVMKEHPWETEFKLCAYPMDIRNEFVYQTDLIYRAKEVLRRQKLPYPRLELVRLSRWA